jgi:hypothetical protein
MRALALALACAGCTQSTDLLPVRDGGAGCAAPIQLGDSAPCAAALAAQLLRYALCSCSALVLQRGLFTEVVTGMPAMRPVGPPPAAVGTDEYLQIAGPVQVAGVLEAAGAGGAGFNRTAGVLGSLRSGGPLRANEFLSVGGDAFVDGDVLGRIDVGGTLHAPASASISPSVSAGALLAEPVNVAPPCNCGASAPVDPGAQIAARAQLNDNARIGLQPGALAEGNGPPVLDVPCGEFYLTAIEPPPDVELELRLHGQAALFVAGPVTLPRGLRVTLDPGAQLDLVVGGDLTVAAGSVGALAAESVRLWLGPPTVRLGDGVILSAAVYAPAAVVLGDGDLGLRGALFAGALSLPGDVSVHYSAALLSGGLGCGAASQDPVQ